MGAYENPAFSLRAAGFKWAAVMQPRTRGVWATIEACGLGALGIALVTALGFRLHFSFLTISFCYLILLVLQSLSGDVISSVVVSVVAVACLDYFFVPPLFSFQIDGPIYAVGLGSFLITGLVISKLVTEARAGTELSNLHHERLQRLYAFAQQLLALETDVEPGDRLLEPFCGFFGIKAVCLFDAVDAELYIAGVPSEDLEKKTGEAFVHCREYENREAGFAARCIRVGGRTIGAIGFEGLEDPAVMAGPLATLAAAHLERLHSFIHASQAAAAAQAESYRTVILDALAHEFKTPLSTILTAAGALREAPTLGPQHREMTEIVESEATRLSRLTSRLIRTARLEREEVRPWIELIDVASVITEAIDQYTKLSAGRCIALIKHCDSTEVMADPELLRLAVSQLLDNACKYSDPGSTVTLSIALEHEHIVLRVLSNGNPIPPGERTKIFDRFYRGIDGRRVGPGSGLGLFVARKIALALGGNIELDSDDPASASGAVFRFALPAAERQREKLATAV